MRKKAFPVITGLLHSVGVDKEYTEEHLCLSREKKMELALVENTINTVTLNSRCGAPENTGRKLQNASGKSQNFRSQDYLNQYFYRLDSQLHIAVPAKSEISWSA